MIEDKDAVELNQEAVCFGFRIPRETKYMQTLMKHIEVDKKECKNYEQYWRKNFNDLKMVYALEWVDVYVHKSPNSSAEVLRSYYFGFGKRGLSYPPTSSATDPSFNIFGIKGWDASSETFILSYEEGIFVESVRTVTLLVNKALIHMQELNRLLRRLGFGHQFKYGDTASLLLEFSLNEVRLYN